VTDPVLDDNAIPAYKRGYAWIDGEFVPAATASVSIFDHSFLYGDGVFESIVCRHGRPFALIPHLDRLAYSCKYLQLDLPYDNDELERIVLQLLERNELGEGYVRIVVSRGEGYPVSDPRKAETPTIVISVQGSPAVTRDRETGLKLAIVSTRRIPAICLEPRVKSNNYLNHIVAKLEAIAAGAEDAIMLDVDGNIAELPVANVFARHGSLLSTPPQHGILAGITRATVMRLVGEGTGGALEMVTREMSPYDLFTADEAFVVGTGTGVASVATVDGRTIGDGSLGPVTAQVMDAYDALIERECSDDAAAVAR
jgi:branched-chain amino acid aminotransferase